MSIVCTGSAGGCTPYAGIAQNAAMRPHVPETTAAEPRRRAMAWTVVACAAAFGMPGTARAAHAVRPWPRAKPVPGLDLADLAGRHWSLAPLRGQVVLLNFWATWCEPCRAEMPSLLALQAARQGEHVTVITVNYREPPEQVRGYLEHLPNAPLVLLDSDGEATSAWTPRVFPSTVLIGRDGVPVATVLGDLEWTGHDAKALLDPLVAAREPVAGGAKG